MRKRENHSFITIIILNFVAFFGCCLLGISSVDVAFEGMKYFRRKGRIFDTFMYNNEVEMLYIRLWRLYDYVDYFIIVVSNTTHSGKPKDLFFSPFEKEIQSYSKKIVIEFIPESILDLCYDDDHWCRENIQRDYALDVIERFSPDYNDLILVSDVDEIFTREVMRMIIRNPPIDYYKLNGVVYFPYYFHYHERWPLAAVVRYESSISLSYYRNAELESNNTDFPRNCVTHCSYCFRTIEGYLNKIRSFAHQEYNVPPYNSTDWIFKSHYCREKIGSPGGYDDENTNWSELIPDNPHLYYLVDPSYMYDISLTNYTYEDLPNLCSRQFNRQPFFGNPKYDNYYNSSSKTVLIRDKSDNILKRTSKIPEIKPKTPKRTRDIPQQSQNVPQRTLNVPEKTQNTPKRTISILEKTLNVPERTQNAPER